MNREIKPFAEHIPHLYPGKNLSNRDRGQLLQERHHEGEKNHALVTPQDSVLFNPAERFVLQNPKLLEMVEGGKFTIPDFNPENQASLDSFLRIATWAATEPKERKKTEKGLLTYCYENNRADTSERWDALKDALEYQQSSLQPDEKTRNNPYKQLLSTLRREFEPPEMFRGKIRFETHFLSSEKNVNEFIQTKKADLKSTFRQGQRNILLLEYANNSVPHETFRQNYSKALLHFSYDEALIAVNFLQQYKRFPTHDEMLQEMSEIMDDPSGVYLLGTLKAINELPEFHAEVDVESSHLPRWSMTKAIERVNSLESFKSHVTRSANSVLARDQINANFIDDLAYGSIQPTNLYAQFGSFHSIGLSRFLSFGLSQVIEFAESGLIDDPDAKKTEIFNALLKGSPVTDEQWKNGYIDPINYGVLPTHTLKQE